MKIISKNQLDSFINDELRKIMKEEFGEDSFEEQTKEFIEKRIERLDKDIEVEKASVSKATDSNLRSSIQHKINYLKNQKADAEEELDHAEEEIRKNKIEQKKREMEADKARKESEREERESVLQGLEELIEKPVTKNPSDVLKQKPVKKKKETIVKFDSKTKNPFNVSFSERGFLVGDTRLSFELLEMALSKGFNITLKNGLVLDQVKMQKILKYKDKF